MKERFSDKVNLRSLKDAKKYPGVGVSGWGYAVDEEGPVDPLFNTKLAVPFWVSDKANTPGDGTVPACSGEMLQKLTPPLKEVFGIPGYDHQAAFDDKYAYRATIYCIARIIQNATPPPAKESLSCSASAS